MKSSRISLHSLLLTSVALGFIGASQCKAGLALFSNSTDTISVAGGTSLGNSATFEASIFLTAAPVGPTSIFNEYTFGQEDKSLGFDSNELLGYGFPVSGSALRNTVSLALNTWHHVAFVYDGAQDRLYLDGSLVISRSSTGSIGNASGNPFIGAISRTDGFPVSFQGYIDTLRISDVARYSGASFLAPIGDLASDANTQLLYNFDEASGSTTVADLSGNGHTGTLGTGFSGATSPQFIAAVPEASVVAGLLGTCGLGMMVRRRRRV